MHNFGYLALFLHSTDVLRSTLATESHCCIVPYLINRTFLMYSSVTKYVDKGHLLPSEYQPRILFSPSGINALQTSLESANGNVSPLIAVDNDDGSYSILSGERWWRAARQSELIGELKCEV